MQKTTASRTTGSDQLHVIRAPNSAWDQRSISVKVGRRVMEVSIDEMEFYTDLFETMFEELDRREAMRTDPLEGLLDEFDRAEIERLRQSFG